MTPFEARPVILRGVRVAPVVDLVGVGEQRRAQAAVADLVERAQSARDQVLAVTDPVGRWLLVGELVTELCDVLDALQDVEEYPVETVQVTGGVL